MEMNDLDLSCFLVSVCHRMGRSAEQGICIAVIDTAVGHMWYRRVGDCSAQAGSGHALIYWRYVIYQASQRGVCTRQIEASGTQICNAVT